MDLTIKLPKRVDSDSTPEFKSIVEKMLDECENDLKDIVVIFDAGDMEYISSAGLRILLSVKKKVADVNVVNASNDICEIFEVTGFESFIKIIQKLDEVNIDGLEMVGQGANSKVYRLNNEKVVKVYKDNYSLKDVEKIQAMTKKAIGLGVDTMISYGVVKVGEAYGAVYEMLDAIPVLEWIKTDPDNEMKYLKLYVDFVKKNHEIEVDDQDVKSIKKVFYDRIDKLTDSGFYSVDEAMTARQIVYSIPDKNTYLHGDCHIGNVMLSKNDDELFFIDLPVLSKGNPIFDIFGMAWMRLAPQVLPADELKSLIGLDIESLARIWREILSLYFETEDKSIIDELDRQYTVLECLNLSMAETYAPGLFTSATLEWLKAEGLKGAEFEF